MGQSSENGALAAGGDAVLLVGGTSLDGQECPSCGDFNRNDAALLRQWLAAQVAGHLRVEPEEIDVRAPLSDFGLDSIILFSLTGELAERLGRDLTATLLWDYPTIDSLAEYLAQPAVAEDISA